MQFWLVKQEPEAYSWADLLREKRTAWTGVRNFQARNYLRAMESGDPVFFYHSGSQKQIVGVARVERAAYADPTATEGAWVAVDLAPLRALASPVGLDAIKQDSELGEMQLVRHTRLSVMPLTRAQFERVLKLGGTRLEHSARKSRNA